MKVSLLQTVRPGFRLATRRSLASSAKILSLPLLALRQRVEEELAANPALELDVSDACVVCGASRMLGLCRHWASPAERPRDDLSQPQSKADWGAMPADPWDQTASPVELRSFLTTQAYCSLPARDHAVADYLIGSITDKGLLGCEPEEASEALRVPRARVLAVLRRLQELEPIGVAARSPREALLIQISYLEHTEGIDPEVRRLVEEYWEALARRSYAKIARELGLSRPRLEMLVQFLRRRLHPYPGYQYYSRWQPPGDAGVPASPDLSIRRELDNYRVEVSAAPETALRISSSYEHLRRLAARTAPQDVPQEWRGPLEAVERARWFLTRLAMRTATLRLVGECLAARQRGYLDTERPESLRPLTQAQVADQIGKHESTVSRAVAGKFGLLPSGTLVALSTFFDGSAAPKSIIAEIVAQEDPAHPVTDSHLCSILRARGHDVSRRTVAKYRLAAGVPSHEQRHLRAAA